MAGPLPATMAASPAAAGPLVSTAATTPGATGAGGMGMYPPMLGHGGRGGGDSKERDKRLYPDKRIVVRTVPNTEPVFGELPHEPRRRPNRLKDQEEAE
jgi:hypothetical protein